MSVPSSRQKRSRSPPSVPAEQKSPQRGGGGRGVTTTKKKKFKAAPFAKWCEQPLWVLDSWTYEVPVLMSKEFATYGAEVGPQNIEENQDEIWVRRSSERETNMVVLQEGAALAALCGGSGSLINSIDVGRGSERGGSVEEKAKAEEEEDYSPSGSDRRDVALVVAMAKMIAFLPFRGIRANGSYHCGKGTEEDEDEDNNTYGLPLARRTHRFQCDHRNPNNVDKDGEESTTMKNFPPSTSLYKTTLVECLYTDLQCLENPVSECAFRRNPWPAFIACGAVGDIHSFHLCVKIIIQKNAQEAKRAGIWCLQEFIKGAIMSDNPTSLDLLLRFPPPQWVGPDSLDVIESSLHLSNAREPHFVLEDHLKTSQLTLISRELDVQQPGQKCGVVDDEQFRQAVRLDSDPSALPDLDRHYRDSMSHFHARLVANMVRQKEYPRFENAHINFPTEHVALLIADLGIRLPRGGVCAFGVQDKRSVLDLSILAVETHPQQHCFWFDVNTTMKRGEAVWMNECALSGQSRSGDMENTKKVLVTQVEVIVKTIELALESLEDKDRKPGLTDDPTFRLFHNWVSLSMKCDLDTVRVAGKPYTMIACAQQALNLALTPKNEFAGSAGAWCAVGLRMLPPSPSAMPPAPETAKPRNGAAAATAKGNPKNKKPTSVERKTASSAVATSTSTDTYFMTHVSWRDGRQQQEFFTNIECLLVALSMAPGTSDVWTYLGYVLWTNSERNCSEKEPSKRTSEKGEPGGVERDLEAKVSVPISTFAPSEVKDALVRVLKSQGKTLTKVKVALSAVDAKEVKGAGGQLGPIGSTPCKHVYELNEVECYLISLELEETPMLTRLAYENPIEMLKRVVEVVKLDNLSE